MFFRMPTEQFRAIFLESIGGIYTMGNIKYEKFKLLTLARNLLHQLRKTIYYGVESIPLDLQRKNLGFAE